MRSLNLGVLAHVDAGKTTLTERLLHEAGAIRRLGRVDHGDTVTDSDELERRRGITIRTAVATMTLPSAVGDVLVNLIDTPGHSDFVAEVERALAVLDGAVLVVSAVEGVQAQTRVLVRTLERMGLPFLVFVNKVDRAGASFDATVAALGELLERRPVPVGPELTAEEVVDAVSPWDERLLEEYVETAAPLARDRLLDAEAVAALAAYLPVADGDASAPLHASVFKIDRDPEGHRVAYARLHAGTLAPREPVALHRRTADGAVTARTVQPRAVAVVEHGTETCARPARAGEVAVVAGLPDVAVGDQLGRWEARRAGRHFPDPGLESVVEARDPRQRTRLFEALRELAEQDPLIDARVDPGDGTVAVTVYGEVQKQVLATRLAESYGVLADFLPTRVVHVERVSGVGERHAESPIGNVRIGLRLEPAAAGAGLDYGLAPEVEKGWLLPQYHHALEEQLSAELASGLHGWRVADLTVRTVASRWSAPVPAPTEVRAVTHVAFRRALEAASTVVCAPVSRFELDVPDDSLSAVLGALLERGATPEPVGPARVVGTIPTGQVAAFEQRLPGWTAGRGVLRTEPAGYEPVQAGTSSTS